MPTPEEIAQRRFLVTLRGYDREQVHAFLDEVSRHVVEVERRSADLAAELDAARARLVQAAPPAEEAPARPFAELGEETQRVLEAAHEAGGSITRKARQDADRQLQQARQHAARIIAEAERERDRVAEVVTRLEQRRAELAAELAGVGQAIERLVADLAAGDEAPTVRQALAAADAPAPREGALQDEPQGASQRGGQDEPHEGRGRGGQGGQAQAAGTGAATVAAHPADDADAAASAPPLAEGAVAPAAGDDAAGADVGAAHAAEGAADATADAAADAESPGLVGQATSDAVTAPVPDPAASADSTAQEVLEAESAGDASSPVALRAGALEPVHPKMMRRLKRGMSDLQNLVLDRLRRTSGRKGVDALLPDDSELAVLAEVAEPFLDQAYESGTQAAAVLAGRRLGAPTQARVLAEDFAADSSDRLRHSLVVSLRIGLEGGETLPALNDRVGAVFSDLKSTATDELSAIHLIRAYEFGLLDAWAAGGVAQRTWVLGRELRCPEGRCRQNDETGAVDVSKAFASGHEVPPVHVGCTCTTIPVLEP